MEPFFIKLAVVAIPFVTLVIATILTGCWPRKRRALRIRAQRTCIAARHAFAVAAAHKWF